jgi:hypothetical protein
MMIIQDFITQHKLFEWDTLLALEDLGLDAIDDFIVLLVSGPVDLEDEVCERSPEFVVLLGRKNERDQLIISRVN